MGPHRHLAPIEHRHPESLLAANVAAFILTAMDLIGADMGRLLVEALPKITQPSATWKRA